MPLHPICFCDLKHKRHKNFLETIRPKHDLKHPLCFALLLWRLVETICLEYFLRPHDWSHQDCIIWMVPNDAAPAAGLQLASPTEGLVSRVSSPYPTVRDTCVCVSMMRQSVSQWWEAAAKPPLWSSSTIDSYKILSLLKKINLY